MDAMSAIGDKDDDIELVTSAVKTEFALDLALTGIAGFLLNVHGKLGDDITIINDKEINIVTLGEILTNAQYKGEIYKVFDSGAFDLMTSYVVDYLRENENHLYVVAGAVVNIVQADIVGITENLSEAISDVIAIFKSEYNFRYEEIKAEIEASDVGNNTLGEGIPGYGFIKEKEDGGIIFRGSGGSSSMVGTEKNDYLHGGNGQDIICGGDGNDIIFGGRGDDSLNGEAGIDRYVVNKYDGVDTIVNSGTENELNFIYLQAGITEVEYIKVGEDLYIKYNKDYPDDCKIIVKNFFLDDGNGNLLNAVDAVIYESGAIFDIKEISNLVGHKGTTGKTMMEKLENISLEERNKIFEEYEFLKEIYREKYHLIPDKTLPSKPEDDKESVSEAEDNITDIQKSVAGETENSDKQNSEAGGTGTTGSTDSDDDEAAKSAAATASAVTANTHNSVKDAEYEIIGKKPDKYYEASINTYVDPVVIDLNGDGKYTTSLEQGVHFDFSGDGFAEKTAWVSAGDGLLVRDVNQNGEIDNGSELFGDRTVLKDGTIAVSGFQALSDMDENKDGVLDDSDTGYKEMKIWVDFDQDGISAKEEMYSLNQLGIVSIDLAHNVINKFDTNGNLIKSEGIISGICNDFHINEYGFIIDYIDTIYTGDEIDTSVLPDYLPEIKGCGMLLDLSKEMVLNEQLRNLVETYIAESQISKKHALVQDILFCWAGVTEVDAGSRGGRIDARKLGVLEKVYGKAFVGTNGPNPIIGAAYILNELYVELLEDVKNRLLVQTVFGDALQMINVSYDKDKKEFVCNLIPAIEKLTAENPDYMIRHFTDYILEQTEMGNYFDKQYIL